MQNKRTWLYLILMLILFTLICAQQQQINDLRDDLSALQEQTVQIKYLQKNRGQNLLSVFSLLYIYK